MRSSKFSLPRHSVPSRNLLTHVPFDPACSSSVFPGAKPPTENDGLSAYLMEVHSKIAPSIEEQQSIGILANKVMESLESIALTKSDSNFKIQVVCLVGSCKKGTMLSGHKVADVIVLLRELPVLEQTRQIGLLIMEKLNDLEIIYEPYGFDVECDGFCVRVAFAVQNADEISNVEDGVHICPSLSAFLPASLFEVISHSSG